MGWKMSEQEIKQYLEIAVKVLSMGKLLFAQGNPKVIQVIDKLIEGLQKDYRAEDLVYLISFKDLV